MQHIHIRIHEYDYKHRLTHKYMSTIATQMIISPPALTNRAVQLSV